MVRSNFGVEIARGQSREYLSNRNRNRNPTSLLLTPSQPFESQIGARERLIFPKRYVAFRGVTTTLEPESARVKEGSGSRLH